MSEPATLNPVSPKVSVVMAAYNAAATVGDALESIRSQRYVDWELIVVDDASTDDTREILDAFARSEPRARVIHRDTNGGLATCLNFALREARGALVARMDADDQALGDRFGDQVRFLDDRPDVAILGGGALVIDDNGTAISQLRRPEEHDDLVARIFRENPFVHPTVMARRTVFEDLGGYDTSLRRGQDYDLWLRAYRRFRMHNLPQPLIKYRHGRAPVWRNARYSSMILLRALRREGRLWQAPWLAARPLLATAVTLSIARCRGER